MTRSEPRVAVIGAGMAGATCARRLHDAGADVHVFEKSRGVGGRMATRRVCWLDADGREHEIAFDHGAPGFSVNSAAFAKFIEAHVQSGEVIRWAPAMAPGSFVPLDGYESWIATPRMPDLCRALTEGLPVIHGRTVDALFGGPGAWRVECRGETLGRDFTHVVLAMPPLQAAALLNPHRPDWAQLGRQRPMLPCWTLIGSMAPAAGLPDWDVAWPLSGPLAWVIRNDRKPGRTATDGGAHWVVHANARWSQTHLEMPEDQVHAMLVSALADFLDRTPAWRFSSVHRWRYASVARLDASGLQQFWFDARLGLGVCEDYLGGAGVEGAWHSGDALGTRIAMACGLVAAPTPQRHLQDHRSLS
jgi:predicted NAD/FAD-dependent oxidoreductase